MNKLAEEKSPYLLQHAGNPVDWYPWGPEAFEKARAENKPIFLSIGYSTCHWCHVMERESFENERIAEILNRDYVAIKVDREERPDVDRIYMTFVQATTGGGGWPMSVWLTPELAAVLRRNLLPAGKPLRAPGLRIDSCADRGCLAHQTATRSRNPRAKWSSSFGNTLTWSRRRAETIDTGVLDSGFFVFRRTFDPATRRLRRRAQIPAPVGFRFPAALPRAHREPGSARHGAAHAARNGQGRHERPARRRFPPLLGGRALVRSALREDALRPGAAGRLLPARPSRSPATRSTPMTARAHLRLRAARHDAIPKAASIPPRMPTASSTPRSLRSRAKAHSTSGRDEEIRALVPEPAAEWFCYRYGVAQDGNVVNDPHQEFTGTNILYQAATLEETARQFDRPLEEIQAGLDRGEADAARGARGARAAPSRRQSSHRRGTA